jgi:hypothetical protein
MAAPTFQTLLQYLMWFGDCSIGAAPQDLASSDAPLEARIGFEFYPERPPSIQPRLRFSLTLDSSLRMVLRRPIKPCYATELPLGIPLPLTLQDLARAMHNIQGAARLCKSSTQGALYRLNREFDQLALAHGGASRCFLPLRAEGSCDRTETIPELKDVDKECRILRKLKKAIRPKKPEVRRPTFNEPLPFVLSLSRAVYWSDKAGQRRCAVYHAVCYSSVISARVNQLYDS